MLRQLALAAAIFAPLSAHAVTYTFEPQHTQGIVRWNHLGYSYPTAQFARIEGTLDFDPADPTKASVAVSIPIANLSSGVPDLDEYLRAEEFFDLAKFPSASFQSSKVEKGDIANQFKVSGKLSLRGVTKPVVLIATLNKIGTNPRSGLPCIGFEATTTLKRSDFGLGLYVPQVGDEVEVHLTAEAEDHKAREEGMKPKADEAAAKQTATGATMAAEKKR